MLVNEVILCNVKIHATKAYVEVETLVPRSLGLVVSGQLIACAALRPTKIW